MFCYLLSERENLIKAGFGAAQPNISQQTIRDYPILFPPLNEQKRIVAKLDTILPKMKSAKARLERIPVILKKFRQSVLAAACSGRLTEDWREGKDLSEWQENRIDELFQVKSGSTPLRSNKAFYNNGTIPWVKTGEVKNANIFQTEEFIAQKALDETSIKIFPINTLLIAMYGGVKHEDRLEG